MVKYKSVSKKIKRGQLYLKNKINNSFEELAFRVMPPTNTFDFFEGWRPTTNFDFFVGSSIDLEKYFSNKFSYNPIISTADEICNHKIKIFSEDKIDLGKEILWNKDFRSGIIWKNKYYKKIRLVNSKDQSDVKIPWELSRLQHINVLGQAYIISSSNKYATEFSKQIKDWASKNPYKMSVNWTNAMEVAIRACNLILGYYFFKESEILDDDFWENYHSLLLNHALFIEGNLEKKEISNNHYLTNLIGLVWLGIYFEGITNDSINPNQWLTFALDELQNELSYQVNEDGTNFEASVAYHAFVTEMLLQTKMVCEINEVLFPNYLETKLIKMSGFIENVTKPNGLIPLIGDNDSGRLLKILNYSSLNPRCFIHVPRIIDHLQVEEKWHLKYESIYQVLKDISLTSKIKSNSKVAQYGDGGFYVLKNASYFLVIRCGPNGTMGNGGHSHNDQLSFELNVLGQDFLVDSGSPTYTSNFKTRNMFRSTEYHNTLQIEKKEQNDFNEKSMFLLQNESKAEKEFIDEFTFIGKHYGFLNKTGHIHKRIFKLIDNSLKIQDLIEMVDKNNNGKVKCYIHFILDPKVQVIEKKSGLILRKNGLSLDVITNLKYQVLDTEVSYHYGEINKSKKIRFISDGEDSENLIEFKVKMHENLKCTVGDNNEINIFKE